MSACVLLAVYTIRAVTPKVWFLKIPFFVQIVSSLTRTWIPGPKSFRSGSYHRESFLFIQDMLERAMSEEMLGHSILAPGLYMQQMPYPCFQYDTYVALATVIYMSEEIRHEHLD